MRITKNGKHADGAGARRAESVRSISSSYAAPENEQCLHTAAVGRVHYW